MSARSEKLKSKGWTDDGWRLIEAARAKGVCAHCGKTLRSKFPVGDPRRRVFCWGQPYNDHSRCSDLFYETYYQSWSMTKYRVLRRVREKFKGQIRCESCGQKPKPVKKDIGWDGRPWFYEIHCGYEFDHISEIAAGGDPFDVNNVWLICLRCHRRKTSRFLKRGTPSARPETLRSLESFSD